MNLVIQKIKDKQYVSFKESFWDPQKKRYSSRTVKNFGRLDILEKDNPNVLEELKAQAAKAKALAQEKKELILKQRVNELSNEKKSSSYADNLSVCLGSAVYRQIWNKLELQKKFRQLADGKDIQYNFANAVFFLLTARSILPDSKLSQWLHRNQFLFGASELSLSSLYRALDLLIENKESVLGYLNKQIEKLYNRKVSVALYDVTTYYFESQDVDNLRNFGFSKDNKVNQVQVVMGLLIDEQGIPIDYELYPGNTSEFGTMIPLLKKIQSRYKIDKVIVTADRGLNSGNNLRQIKALNMNYVIAYRLRNAPASIKKLITDKEGWTYRQVDGQQDKCDVSKFRITQEKRWVQYEENGQKKSQEVISNLLINYSAKRARKDKNDRMRLIAKAQRFVDSPSLLKSELHRGGKSYLKIDNKLDPSLDSKKIEEAEVFDGYYGIAYSDPDMSAQQVMDIHHSLWQIEQSFRICKSLLDARPCFHWKENRIRAHFFVCYLALTMHRLLERELKKNGVLLSSESIVEALQTAVMQKIDVRPGESIYCKSFTKGVFEKICTTIGLGKLPTIASAQQVKRALHLRTLD